MAFGVESVTQVKDFDITQQSLVGDAVYRIDFFYDDLDELADYAAIAFICFTAVDPVTALAIPQFNTVLSGDINTFVTDVAPKINRNQQSQWLVTVSYAPLTPPQETVEEDPTTDELVYDWTEVLESEKRWTDANGVPIVTSSGGGFTALPQIDNVFLSCTVSRNSNAYDPDDALSVINHINASSFSIDGNSYAKGLVKCKGWRGRKRVVTIAGGGTKIYHSESLIFLIRDEPWLGRVFDQDTYYLAQNDTAGLKAGRTTIKDKYSEDVTRPQPLNGAGLPIYDNGQLSPVHSIVPVAYNPPNHGVESVANGTVAMLTFQFWKEASFGITGIT